MTAGRPTKYKPEYCQAIIDHFSYDDELPDRLPTITNFSKAIGVHDNTIDLWAKAHPEFMCALMRAKELQREIWLQNSLIAKYNPQFSKFVGINVMGWKDKQEHELSGPNGGPIESKWTVEIVSEPTE